MILELETTHPENFPPGCWNDIPAAWVEIVTDCILKMLSLEPTVKIVQYKEKFNSLRIYYSIPGLLSSDPRCAELDCLVRKAETAVYDLERAAKT